MERCFQLETRKLWRKVREGFFVNNIRLTDSGVRRFQTVSIFWRLLRGQIGEILESNNCLQTRTLHESTLVLKYFTRVALWDFSNVGSAHESPCRNDRVLSAARIDIWSVRGAKTRPVV